MPRRRPVELNISHERWLVSYSDFITLLFAFFVVMYSVSQVNESKYRILSDTLVDAFHTQPAKSLKPIQVGQPTLAADPSVIDSGEVPRNEFTGDGAFEKSADLPQLSQRFREKFADLIDEQLVKVDSNEFWLQLELKSSILFASASADPSLQAQTIFEQIAQQLKGFDNPVQVEGFTDNIPINNFRYASNWELSAARAAAVVKLLAEGGVAPQRLSAVGYGKYQPVADNGTESGRTQNRRVVLMIAREKIDRPGIEQADDLERMLSEAAPDGGQTRPQPGLEQADASATAENTVQTEADGREVMQKERVGSTKPIELEGGGLLFSSDPQLPRNNP